MEIEWFVDPANWEAEFEKWRVLGHKWCDALGLPANNVHELEVSAEDLAHYSKRTILAAVYGSTMAVFLNDESEDFTETRAFLARRIEQVMHFESWKHRRAARSIERPSLARFVGRLRYPGR